MNPIVKTVLRVLLQYLKDHPEQVTKLISELLDFLLGKITAETRAVPSATELDLEQRLKKALEEHK